MTLSRTAGVQISETLFFITWDPYPFKKHIVLNFHHLVCYIGPSTFLVPFSHPLSVLKKKRKVA